MINKTNMHYNQTPVFKANPYQVARAIQNGAGTCPHVLRVVEKLTGDVEKLGRQHGLKIDIPLRGGNIRGKTLGQLPPGASREATEAVNAVVDRITKPFGGCSGDCSRLKIGEVISNVFAIWTSKNHLNVGNPFMLSTKPTPLSPVGSAKKWIKGLVSRSERNANQREALGLTRNPLVPPEQQAAFYKKFLAEAQILPEEVSSPIVRAALQGS